MQGTHVAHNITLLKCSSNFFNSHGKNLQGLRKLYMYNSFTSDLIVKNIISQIPRLRKLDLGVSNPELTDETAGIISFSLITSQGRFKEDFIRCKKLLVIDLSGCY